MFTFMVAGTRPAMVTFNILVIGVCLAGVGWSAEPAAEEEKSAKSERDLEQSRKLVDRINSGYELSLGGDVPLKMEPQPVLRWPNVTRDTLEGATYIWTRNGRPEAIACVWENNNVWAHAFHSLSESKLTAKHRGRAFWHTEKAGIEFSPFPQAPEPADTPVKRLGQMKELAQRFKCRLVAEEKQELRFLPRPLYRYQTDRQDLIDGALFAYVTGTNPEVVLVLEAVRSGETSAWI